MWCAIILGGGTGTRMHSDTNKVLLPIDGIPIIYRSVSAFMPFVELCVVVTRPEERQAFKDVLYSYLKEDRIIWADAGKNRQESVFHALQSVPETCDYVLIHDGARCMIDPNTIRRVMAAVPESAAVIPGIQVTDTIIETDSKNYETSCPDRSVLRAVQTPQGFTLSLIKHAYLQALKDSYLGTDDSSLVRRLGVPVKVVAGHADNLKITYPEDIMIAESKLHYRNGLLPFRTGLGYDVHRLVPGRKFILCGVEIPYEYGLEGHSDADVAVHALMDAMLGAAALGDIGKHFPDNDPQYKGISSMILLSKVVSLLRDHGFVVSNMDLVIAAQSPKLMPYIPLMREKLSEVLQLSLDRISVKATTTEHLGFEGRKEGISAQCIVLLSEINFR